MQVWLDARISSIERKPHETGCSCQFYVNLYKKQGPLGSEKATLNGESVAVGIDEISILQKLDKNSREDQHYCWELSEDCPLLPRSKLLLGRFLSDLSWLLVTSSLKQIAFDVRSVQNKIIYQILEGDDDYDSSNSNGHLTAVNFKEDNNGMMVPIIVQLAPANSTELDLYRDPREHESNPLSEVIPLRRSKRRNVKPERFLACVTPLEIEIGYVQGRPHRTDRREDDEMPLLLSSLFGVNNETDPKASSDSDYTPLSKWKTASRKEKLRVKTQKRHRGQLAIVPSMNIEMIHIEPQTLKPRNLPNHAKQSNEIPLPCYYTKSNHKQRRKNIHDEDLELGNMWDKKASSNGRFQKKKYQSLCLKNYKKGKSYRKRTLGEGAYDELINTFLKNMDCTAKEEPNAIDQWKEIRSKKYSGQSSKAEVPPNDDEEEMSETEMLWKEMELALASAYILDDNEVCFIYFCDLCLWSRMLNQFHALFLDFKGWCVKRD